MKGGVDKIDGIFIVEDTSNTCSRAIANIVIAFMARWDDKTGRHIPVEHCGR